MKSHSIKTALQWAVTIGLGLGILPSFTALSISYQFNLPSLYRLTGPLNPIKALIPVFLAFLWTNREIIPKKLLQFLGLTLLIGSLSSVIAHWGCKSLSTAFIREWVVICVGVLSGLCLFILKPSYQRIVIGLWIFILLTNVTLNYFFPNFLEQLTLTVFDPLPRTQAEDYRETAGQWYLAGIFGRQSMAKLLSWSPWLLLLFFFKTENLKKSPVQSLIFLGLALFLSALILFTTQRGPFVGALAGWLALGAHQIIRLGQKKVGLLAFGACILTVVVTLTFADTPLIKGRLKSLVGIVDPDNPFSVSAAGNQSKRVQILQFSTDRVKKDPFGNACIPNDNFYAKGLDPSHSHNLFLEQYRARGIIWGTFHVAIWLLALLGGWLNRGFSGSVLLAAVITTLVSGLVDHPWPVLNHALVMGLFLVFGIQKFFEFKDHPKS